MDLFEIDLDEIIYETLSYRHSDSNKFTEDELTEQITQADCVIKNENEARQKRAEACVKKFQLLRMQKKLAPKLLEKALELYPDMPQALTEMGKFYFHIDEEEKALEYFDNVITLFPSYPYIWLEIANRENDTEKQRECYSNFIKLKPDSMIGYQERCWLNRDIISDNNYFIDGFRRRRDIENAKIITQQLINDYSELIRLDRTNFSNYEERATLYLMNDRIALIDIDNDPEEPVNFKAVKDIEQMLLLYPEDYGLECITVVHNMLNYIQDETKQKYFSQMICDLSPDIKAYWIVHAFLADAFEYTNGEEAIQIYSKAINALKEGEQLQLHCYHQRGMIYSWIKNYTNALVDFAKIANYSDLSSQNTRGYYTTDPYFARERRIKIFEEMNDIENVINEYTAILTDPFFLKNEKELITDAYINRAKIFMKNKEYDKALYDYSSAIDSRITGYEHTLMEAFTARIEIYKIRGKMEKVSDDLLKMSELKEESFLDNAFTVCSDACIQKHEYEIMDGI
jgi:tetratricopeptide (TPR) repeat protein